MLIDNVVNINVTKTGASVSRQGFGTPLLLSQFPTTVFSNRFKTYASQDEMLTDGFASTDIAYLWAGVQFAAKPVAPSTIAIGRRGEGTAQEDTLAITAPGVGTWTLTLNSIVYSYLAGGSDTNQTIAQGLLDQIQDSVPSAEPVVASDATAGVGTVTARVQGVSFTNGGLVVAGAGAGTFVNTTANVAAEVMTDALDAVVAENDEDWYFLNIENRDDTDIELAAAWIAPRKKIGNFQTRDPDMATATVPNLGSTLAALSYTNVNLFWKSDETHFFDGGMTALAAAADLDSENGVITWFGKQLVGVPTDSLTASEVTNIAGDNEATNGQGGNVYVEIGGRGMVMSGKSVEGEFSDVQTTLDWAYFRAREAVFAVMATTSTKVGGDNAGIASLGNAVLGVLNIGTPNGHFSPDFENTVSFPNSSDRPTVDKNARVLRNVVGLAQIKGAIHKTFVQVNVSA